MIYAFIDAANLFYGGEKSLGWKIDYQKLLLYLKNKFSVSRAYYYAGIDIGNFKSKDKEINLKGVMEHFQRILRTGHLKEIARLEIERYI